MNHLRALQWRRVLWPRSPAFRRVERGLAVLLALLLLGRVTAPWVLQRAINARLAQVPEYAGHVGDIDLALWRCAYAIDNLEITKRQGEINAPFFSARRLDFSLGWRDLFRGRIVGDLSGEKVKLTFARTASPAGSQLEADRRWQDLVQDLFPIELQHVEIKHGDLRYIDQERDPDIDVAVHDVHLIATGLRNRRTTSAAGEVLPAQVALSGFTVGEGELQLHAALAPLEPQPYFDVSFAVRGVQLTALNTLLRAYANVDVSGGTFDLFLETAGRDGTFEGYVKPFFQNLDFKNLTDEQRSLAGRIWESVVATLNSVVKNRSRDQLGTRVPFRGDFAGTRIGTFAAIWNAMRHGFVQAFSESIDGELQPADVATTHSSAPP